MPYKDKQKIKEYQREWTKRKRLGLPTKIKGKREKISEEEKRRHKLEYNKRYKIKKRKEAEKIFGITCFFCNSTTHLLYHQKDGNSHKYKGNGYIVALKQPDKYVHICMKCHIAVHWMMKFLNWTWDDINRNLFI